MIAQFKQNLNNKKFTLQDQGKDDPTGTLENRYKFWLNIISTPEGPVPNDTYNYEYDNEGLYHSVPVAEIFSEIRELKKLMDIL